MTDLNMATVLECVKNSRRVLQQQMEEVSELKVGTLHVFHYLLSLSRVSKLTRDIDIAILSVRPSVRNTPVLYENGLTYRHSFSAIR